MNGPEKLSKSRISDRYLVPRERSWKIGSTPNKEKSRTKGGPENGLLSYHGLDCNFCRPQMETARIARLGRKANARLLRTVLTRGPRLRGISSKIREIKISRYLWYKRKVRVYFFSAGRRLTWLSKFSSSCFKLSNLATSKRADRARDLKRRLISATRTSVLEYSRRVKR